MMSKMSDRILDEDQEVLYQLKINATAANAAVEVSTLKGHASFLEYENAMLKMYLKYGLSIKDSINEATGEIRIGKENEESTDDQGDAGTS